MCNYLIGSKRAWVRDHVYAPSAQNSSKRLQTWHRTTRATGPASVTNQSWTQGGVVISLSLLKILECRVAFNPRINCLSVESYPESHAAAKIAHVPWTITVALLSTSISSCTGNPAMDWLFQAVTKVPAVEHLSFSCSSTRNNNLFCSVLISFSGNLTSQWEILDVSLKADVFMPAALRLCFGASHITYRLAWLCWALYNDSIDFPSLLFLLRSCSGMTAYTRD